MKDHPFFIRDSFVNCGSVGSTVDSRLALNGETAFKGVEKEEIFIMPGFFLVCLTLLSSHCVAQFMPTAHRSTQDKVVPVSTPGTYAVPGTTYMLVNDISAPMTTMFLGKDVTLDLNGYTLRYADAAYEHIRNSGFEEGVAGWDLSRAPGAVVEDAETVHVFIGKKIMRLKKGDEITSSYVNLPVANRSYFAMCGVTGRDYHDMDGDLENQMKVSVYVEDEHGRPITTVTEYGDTTLISCPVENRAPRLGGGFVYAHINNLPAGRYRVRIRAETDCLIDEVDIRPALDAGIGIVEKTFPMGHYDHLYRSALSAFFDYTADVRNGIPYDSIPAIEGGGTITIKNGVIENGTRGVASWGIQSTAENVSIILDNVKFVTSGINTIAADLPQATITNCRFEVDNPFIINRHNSNFYAVDLRGKSASEVSFSEFFGGQGCLVFKGKKSSVHHNRFVNRQMVTNHYSIMAMGDSSKIFENRIEPEIGSGIEIYVHKYIEIFNNTIKIKTSPPTCEYGHEAYSTAAIRMADYRAKPGAANGCYGNKVYNNTIHVLAEPQNGVDSYLPMAWAIYYSASGGDNDVFGNDIIINKQDPGARVLTTAFYICGGDEGFGGKFYRNTITTNVPAAWIGTPYGSAANSKIYDNTIVKSPDAPANFKSFRMGWSKGRGSVAKNIAFRSNRIIGSPFEVERTNEDHTFSVSWSLTVQVRDKEEQPVASAQVVIRDKDGRIAFSGRTDHKGLLKVQLPEYVVRGPEKVLYSPYTVQSPGTKARVLLNKDSLVALTEEKQH